MPKTRTDELIFTIIGVVLMAFTMTAFNKYLVYGTYSRELFLQIGIGFCQRAPLAFVLQFFFVQKFVAKQAEKYPTDNAILYRCIRTGLTVMIFCPIMSVYSQVINAFAYHWGFIEFINSLTTKTPVNWIFAFCVQIWILGQLNIFIFKIIKEKILRAPIGELAQ
jgi:hypothetical protein